MNLRCAHCGRPIRRDSAQGQWPGGPIGPVCASHLGAVSVTETSKAPRVRIVRAAVNGTQWHDPAQMELELA